MKNIHTILLLISIVLILGCRRGCNFTTSDTLEERFRDEQIGPYKAEVRIKKVKYTHRHRDGRTWKVDNEYETFGIEYELSMPIMDEKSIFHKQIDDESYDIDQAVDLFETRLGPGGDYFIVGIEGYVMGEYGILNGKAFPTSSTPLLELLPETVSIDEADLLSMEKYPFKILPNPKQVPLLISRDLKSCTDFNSVEQKVYAHYVLTKPIQDSLYFYMLNLWPECDIAKEVYKDDIVRKLSGNKIWYGSVRKKAIAVMTELQLFEDEEAKRMLTLLDKGTNRTLDSIYAEKFGGFSGRDAEEYVFNALEKRELSAEAIEIISARGKKSNSDILRGDYKSDMHAKPETFMKFFLLTHQQDEIDRFFAGAFREKVWEKHAHDLISVFFENYGMFTNNEQDKIIDGCSNAMAFVRDYEKENLIRKLAEHMNCSDTKALYEKYKADLDNIEIEDLCNPGA